MVLFFLGLFGVLGFEIGALSLSLSLFPLSPCLALSASLSLSLPLFLSFSCYLLFCSFLFTC